MFLLSTRMEAMLQSTQWLPLKDVSAETEGDPCSPITIVAQDYLEDPPVRDVPIMPPPAPERPSAAVSVSTQKDAPPHTDVSHAIAATASAVACSVPLCQLQRSIDTFCSALLARDSRQPEPAPDRYSLRMIEDLDFIKYQLSSRERAPAAPAREEEMVREFQSEIKQLKLRLDERGTFDRFLTPLSQLQQEVETLKTALASRSSPQEHSSSPHAYPSRSSPQEHSSSPHVFSRPSNIETVPSNNLVSQECQTQVTPIELKQATSVSIQTSSPLPSRPRRPIPSPILSSSPVPSLPSIRVPPNRLRRVESRLRAIQTSRRQIDSRPPALALPLSDIIQHFVGSSDDVTYRTRMLVSDKLDTLRPTETEPVSRGRGPGKGAKPVRREGRGVRHQKDPVYISRVYGNKQNLKETPHVDKPTQPDSAEITRVYQQIELIRSQMEQLTSRHAATPTAIPQQLSVPMTHTPVPRQRERVARLTRPPRLMPSPYSPLPQDTAPTCEIITCDHAQVQTSFLSPSGGSSRHGSPRRELVTSHGSILPNTDTLSALVQSPEAEDPGVSIAATLVTMDAVSPVESQQLEQLISLQAIHTTPGGERSPLETAVPLEPEREQELGRRHLLERVHRMLVQRATESVSDRIRLCQARESEERERRLAAEVEDVTKRDILACIQAAREGLRAEREAAPPSEPKEEHSDAETAPLSEDEYSLSFVSDSDDASQHSSLQSLPLIERLSLSPFSPNSTLRSLPRPASATPRPGPSPHSPILSLPISPHSFLTPLSPEPLAAVSAEVQCDMGDRTLHSPAPSSPASTVHTATPSPSDLDTDTESADQLTPRHQEQVSVIPAHSHLDVETQCDLGAAPLPLPSSTPITKPSPAHAETQCDLETAPLLLPLLCLPTPFSQPPKLSASALVQCDMLSPTHVSELLSYTDTETSSRGTEPSYLSEGEYVPPRRHAHRHLSSSPLSQGEVPLLSRLSPAVEAALCLKNLPPDTTPSPGEFLPEHLLRTPLQASRQREGLLSPSSLRSPLPSSPCPPVPSPGNSDTRPSDSDHLSQSVTLSIAFSSPSNKTTTRHREGVDVFDVSALAGLPLPPGWEQSDPSGTGDTWSSHKAPRLNNPAFQQPHHQFETPHLDKSNNSTTCDVHSLESVT